MSVQEDGKVCILCHSVCPSEGGNNQVISGNRRDEQVNLINRFYRNVQLNDDHGEGETNCSAGNADINSYDLIQLNGQGEATHLVGVCDKCDVILKSALESKNRVDQVEICVRRLQTELLRELRNLHGQLNSFYDEIEKIKVTITKSRSKSMPLEEMDLFERRIRQVLKDLTAVKQHNSCTLWENHKGNPGSSLSSDEEMGIGRSTPACEDLDMVSLLVKTEIDPDEQCSPCEEPELNFTCDEDGSETNADSDDTDNEEDEFVPSNERQSDHEATDDDDPDNEKSASSNSDDNAKHLYVQGIKRRTRNKYDYKGMSQFKETIIRRLIKRKERILDGKPSRKPAEPVDPKEYEDEDPRDRYYIDYDFQTDILSLENITIALVEVEHNKYLECSECCFRVEPSRRDVTVDNKMLNHILGRHLHAFKCPICGITKVNVKGYNNHMRGHSNKYVCDICGKQMFSATALKSHKWRHMNEEEQQTAVKEGLWCPGRVKIAQAQQGSTVNPFQCATCGMSFKVKGGLTAHEETHQSREHRTTVCPNCGKSMLERSYIYTHRKVCKPQGEQSPEVKCTQCSRTFSTLINMKHHYKRMHSVDSNEKSHVCPTCSKCFKLRNVLLRHIKTHSSERPFECSKGCQMKFKSKRTLRTHMRLCDGSGTRPGPKNGKRKPKQK